jgi:hypothetical protein
MNDKALVTRQELTPQLWDMLASVGEAFHKSGRMSIINPAEGMVKALFCMENGLPLTAARGLYFVNGKLGIESGVIAAMLRQHVDYDYDIKRLDPQGCTIAISRYGDIIGEASFTMDDAERAGLAQKNNYRSYPEDMFFAKAITRAQRRYAPDVFGAPVYSGEGMQDWVEGEVVEKRPEPPGFDQLIEKFGLEACTQAGVFTATNERELWRAVDELSVIVADAESKRADKERAETAPPTIEDIAAEVEADQSPFKNEAA